MPLKSFSWDPTYLIVWCRHNRKHTSVKEKAVPYWYSNLDLIKMFSTTRATKIHGKTKLGCHWLWTRMTNALQCLKCSNNCQSRSKAEKRQKKIKTCKTDNLNPTNQDLRWQQFFTTRNFFSLFVVVILFLFVFFNHFTLSLASLLQRCWLNKHNTAARQHRHHHHHYHNNRKVFSPMHRRWAVVS